jgi:hypothetical protein
MDWDFERIMEVFCGPVGWLRTTSFDMVRMYYLQLMPCMMEHLRGGLSEETDLLREMDLHALRRADRRTRICRVAGTRTTGRDPNENLISSPTLHDRDRQNTSKPERSNRPNDKKLAVPRTHTLALHQGASSGYEKPPGRFLLGFEPVACRSEHARRRPSRYHPVRPRPREPGPSWSR